MRVRYSMRARAHLVAMKEYWLSRSAPHADRMGSAIRATTVSLEYFPSIGHAGRSPGTFEIVVRGIPYVIVYEFNVSTTDEIMILGVFHMAQDR